MSRLDQEILFWLNLFIKFAFYLIYPNLLYSALDQISSAPTSFEFVLI